MKMKNPWRRADLCRAVREISIKRCSACDKSMNREKSLASKHGMISVQANCLRMNRTVALVDAEASRAQSRRAVKSDIVTSSRHNDEAHDERSLLRDYRGGGGFGLGTPVVS